ncbi:MAG TPA: TIGR01777 family oxidoreductase [Terriglobales bacterium]|nr:TIGR01777 family oxidoreductase [Terriglobales bacterium]
MNFLRILISGASGPVGAALVPFLKTQGHTVTRLVRTSARGQDQILWNPARPLSPDSVSGFDAVIHLAGESIVGRWTGGKKQRILDSRTQGTSHLAEAAAKAAQRPRVFISASAVGYYGDRGDEILRENSPSGGGFAAEICRQWEAATQLAANAGIRTALMRLGVVMSADGGALPKMLPPFRLGLGGRLGSGRQWWSWVAVQDVVGAMDHVLNHDELQGPVNTVAPNPVSNAEFTTTLASVLKRPAIFPMPAFAVRLIFGQMGTELFLASQRVEPAKLAASGYQFQHPDLKNALQENLRH